MIIFFWTGEFFGPNSVLVGRDVLLTCNVCCYRFVPELGPSPLLDLVLFLWRVFKGDC